MQRPYTPRVEHALVKAPLRPAQRLRVSALELAEANDEPVFSSHVVKPSDVVVQADVAGRPLHIGAPPMPPPPLAEPLEPPTNVPPMPSKLGVPASPPTAEPPLPSRLEPASPLSPPWSLTPLEPASATAPALPPVSVERLLELHAVHSGAAAAQATKSPRGQR
jgi:hypothetical protein